MLSSEKPVAFRYSELHHLFADRIGQGYHLFVQVPYGYERSNAPYPVVYLLDGDQFFGIVTDVVRLLQHAKEVPDLIVVGVGYGTDAVEHFVKRIRDYSPSRIEKYPDSGGAAQFLQFLVEEIVPFIDTNYRTDPSANTLIGASISGLFALYTLFRLPNPFRQYVISSPSIFWDNDLIQGQEAEYSQQYSALPVKLFLSVGGLEWMRSAIEAFATTLDGRDYNGFELTTAVLEDETHFSVQPAALTRGIRSVFAG
jgi:predicted alpha/beta superfamily hydrolase